MVRQDKCYEIIPVDNSDPGFRIKANRAVALDYEMREIKETKIIFSDGYLHIVPVEGAFSYLLYNR